jgi:hypothetical protein
MGLEVQYTGTDGSVWDLRRGPVRMGTRGIQGFGFPDTVNEITRDAPVVDGAELVGWSLGPRRVWMPLRFAGDWNNDPDKQGAWWRANQLGAYGTFRVTGSNGGYRELVARPVDDDGWSDPIDPFVKTLPFGQSWTADSSPWWLGPEVSVAHQPDASTAQFFGTDGSGGPPFNIISGGQSGDVVVNNPGDQPIWLRAVFHGPISSFSLVIDGHTTAGAIVVADGSALTIDSSPLTQTATLDGTKVTRQLTDVDFAPVAVGATAAVHVEVDGSGLVELFARPRYKRAY